MSNLLIYFYGFHNHEFFNRKVIWIFSKCFGCFIYLPSRSFGYNYLHCFKLVYMYSDRHAYIYYVACGDRVSILIRSACSHSKLVREMAFHSALKQFKFNTAHNLCFLMREITRNTKRGSRRQMYTLTKTKIESRINLYPLYRMVCFFE